MYFSAVAHRSALRFVLALTICVSLLVGPNASGLVSSGTTQEQNPNSERQGKPRPGKPDGDLPDLEDAQRDSHVEREPAPPIPSTLRSPKVPLQPWKGRQIGRAHV